MVIINIKREIMGPRFSAEHLSFLGVETKVRATDQWDTWETTPVSADAKCVKLIVWSSRTVSSAYN